MLLGPGTVLNQRYSISKEIGQGALGRAFVAEDQAIGRKVFLKAFPIRKESSGVARVQRESALLGRLRHPNLIELYDAFVAEEHVLLVFPYLKGETLADRLRQGRLSLDETVRLIGSLADALDYLAREGVVHRDLKPANILLEKERPVLVDFGIAKDQQSLSLTQTGQFVGTPIYVPPEVIEGHPDAGTGDVYALGVVADEMLLGRPPFRGANFAALTKAILQDDLPDLAKECPGLPDELAGLLKSMLSRDPQARPTPVAVRDACRSFSDEPVAVPEWGGSKSSSAESEPPAGGQGEDTNELARTISGGVAPPPPAPAGQAQTYYDFSDTLARTVMVADGHVTRDIRSREIDEPSGFFENEIARQRELSQNREFFRDQLTSDYGELLFQARVSFWLWVCFSIVGFAILVAGMFLLFSGQALEGAVALASETFVLYIQKVFKDRDGAGEPRPRNPGPKAVGPNRRPDRTRSGVVGFPSTAWEYGRSLVLEGRSEIARYLWGL